MRRSATTQIELTANALFRRCITGNRVVTSVMRTPQGGMTCPRRGRSPGGRLYPVAPWRGGHSPLNGGCASSLRFSTKEIEPEPHERTFHPASLLAGRAAARYDKRENRSATAGQREAEDDIGDL
jgi:hypothetical protein